MSILSQLKTQTRVSKLPEQFYRRVNPQALTNPYLVAFSPAVADLLDIDPALFQQQQLIDLLSGNAVAPGSEPIAMLYAGHQFGQYVPQLGGGRALMIGEISDASGGDWEIQLKGSGLTPFSRLVMGVPCCAQRFVNFSVVRRSRRWEFRPRALYLLPGATIRCTGNGPKRPQC